MTKSSKRSSIFQKLLDAFSRSSRNAQPESDALTQRKPTPEELAVIEFMKLYAPPITTVLLELREQGYRIRGPHLGYLALKGTGADLYPEGYAMVLHETDPAGHRSTHNRFFCYEWEILELGHFYLLPVVNQRNNLIAVDYVTRGAVFVRGANLVRRQRRPEHTLVADDLRHVLQLWIESTDSDWRKKMEYRADDRR